MAADDGVGVVGAWHPHVVVEQLLERRGRTAGIPSHHAPVGEVAAGGEDVGVVGAEDGVRGPD